MASVTVADAGPLITFARAGAFDHLHDVFDEIIIPGGVYHEVTLGGLIRPGAADVTSASWIRVRSVADRTRLASLPAKLGAGEREAILLAMDLALPLLADDPEARSEARRRGVHVSGSLGVLEAAKAAGAIEAVRPTLDRLITAGFRISRQLYEQVLGRAGEL
jgi:predicted nucleic acid-binding protein